MSLLGRYRGFQVRLGGAGGFHSEHQAAEGAIITVTEPRVAMTKPVREMHSAARACLGRAIVLAAILLFGVVSLRQLFVGGTQVTAAAVSRFRQDRPDCQITRYPSGPEVERFQNIAF